MPFILVVERKCRYDDNWNNSLLMRNLEKLY